MLPPHGASIGIHRARQRVGFPWVKCSKSQESWLSLSQVFQDRNYKSSYDLATEVRQYYFCPILFVTSESQVSAQIQVMGTIQGHEY